MVALCSKTYICWRGDETKVSSKGLQKSRNVINLTREKYLDVLENQKSGMGTNRGFRAVGGRVFTYEQDRYALSYFYGKRQTLENDVSTIPLNI